MTVIITKKKNKKKITRLIGRIMGAYKTGMGCE